LDLFDGWGPAWMLVGDLESQLTRWRTCVVWAGYHPRGGAREEASLAISLQRAGGDYEQDGDGAYQSLSGMYSPFS
jgi:hypothetical protein